MKEVQGKWKNIRDCFERELLMQEQMKSVDSGTKRWKNMYFEQSLFLIPQIQDHATSSKYSPMTGCNGEEDTDVRPEDEQVSSGGASKCFTCRKKQRRSNTLWKINYEQQLFDILKEKSGHIVEDKTFSFSLVPTFKTMTRSNGQRCVLGIMRKAKNMVLQPQYAQCFTATTFYHRRMSIISNPKTHQHCQIFQTTEL